MGGCLYRESKDQYHYNTEDILLKQKLTHDRLQNLLKLREDREQMQQRYQKNIEEGEKMKQPKKLNQSSVEQSGFDNSLSKNHQNLHYIEEAEDESSFIEQQKPQTLQKLPDEDNYDEGGELLLQLASSQQLNANKADNIRDQLQGRQSNEMDDEILQYFNTTKANYDSRVDA
ncbi:unnamed protein product [Paramecium pentaurelia]|uniref:Uncharacterized protein n=1 Tax=Paramecium pentaurelia TaxID=43138 RepID=A0A8S1TVY4_9CILI|nr:unnamed protein product [Paramecium pentaurelia]CAD8155621.1 unnamed protein product [Paramecium pentaurelia]